MNQIGHNGADINGVEGNPNERLRHYVQRIGRVEDERDTAVGEFREMLKEVRAEAKAAGYDMKALAEMVRLYRMETTDREDQETMRDFYRSVVFSKFGDVPESEDDDEGTVSGTVQETPHDHATGEIIEQNTGTATTAPTAAVATPGDPSEGADSRIDPPFSPSLTDEELAEIGDRIAFGMDDIAATQFIESDGGIGGGSEPDVHSSFAPPPTQDGPGIPPSEPDPFYIAKNLRRTV